MNEKYGIGCLEEKESSSDSSRKSIQEQKTYYNERWTRGSFLNPLEIRRAVTILSLISQLGLESPKILDLGCGKGWFTSMLAKVGPTVGIDISDAAISRAKVCYQDATFICGDVFNTSLAGHPFCIVVSMEVIEHVEDQVGYLRVAFDNLDKNGYLILTTPNADIQNRRRLEELKRWGLQPIENWLNIKQLKRSLQPNFTPIKVFTFLPGYGSLGIMRILNSYKVASLLEVARLKTIYNRMLCYFGFGLHIAALAQKCTREWVSVRTEAQGNT